jgi:hypothetical protein
MPVREAGGKDLLEAVKQMPPNQFDAFIEDALQLRRPPRAATLSAAETRLIKRINRGLPLELWKRHAQLTQRGKKGVLGEAEREELLELTHQVNYPNVSTMTRRAPSYKSARSLA